MRSKKRSWKRVSNGFQFYLNKAAIHDTPPVSPAARCSFAPRIPLAPQPTNAIEPHDIVLIEPPLHRYDSEVQLPVVILAAPLTGRAERDLSADR